MTTPAVNQTQSINLGRYSVWFGTSSSGTEVNGLLRRVRPASQNNPLRPDRTRPPGSYTSKYLRMTPLTALGRFHHRSYPNITGSTSGAGAHGFTTSNVESWSSLQFAQGMLSNARLSALSKGTEKAKELNAFMAEANSTGRMVGKAASRFANGLDNLMQGPKGLARRFGRMATWRDVPGEYLEYCYGWSPLGDDVANAFDRLGSMADHGLSLHYLLRDRKRYTESISFIPPNLYQCGPAWSNINSIRVRGTREISVGATYSYLLPPWFVENVPTVSTFSTLYEQMPYSFVLDWFLPIGDWIGALEAAQFAPHFREGAETIFMRETFDSFELASNNHDYYCDSWSVLSGRAELNTLIRVPVFSAPFVSKPALKPLPGATVAAQGLSLLTQVFKKWS